MAPFRKTLAAALLAKEGCCRRRGRGLSASPQERPAIRGAASTCGRKARGATTTGAAPLRVAASFRSGIPTKADEGRVIAFSIRL